MGDYIYARLNASQVGDSFLYLKQDAVRTRVTGKLQTDFSVRVSKNGANLAFSGSYTIAEVDSVNNPGEYTWSAADAALTTAGKYVITIWDTANPQFVWTWTFVLTADGTASAPIGVALFTPAAGNGRVTDGVSPILGATVLIRTPAGLLYYSATTDAAGLWTPVNFPTNSGVYTVYVIRSGYQQAIGTITVVGAVATGPGTDLVMAAAVTPNGLSAAELWAYARRMMFGVTGTQADIEVKQAVQESLERVATSNRWPWFRRRTQLALRGAYATGTVTLTQGSAIVLLTGGLFPSWTGAGFAKIRVNNQIIKVASSADTTHLTLEAAWVEATAAAVAYTLYQDEYQLPVDLYRFGEILPGPRWGYGPTPVPPETLDALQNAALYGQKVASAFAIQGQNLLLSQYPTQDTLVMFSYYARPTTLNSATDVADWDPAHTRLIRRAIDVEVSLRYGKYVGGTPEQALARYEEALANASVNDRTEVAEQPVMGQQIGSAMDRSTLMWKRLG